MADESVGVWCEAPGCGREETLRPQEAFAAGWDFAPLVFPPGLILPRTCPEHSAEDTVWWALMVDKIDPGELTDFQRAVINRIRAEDG